MNQVFVCVCVCVDGLEETVRQVANTDPHTHPLWTCPEDPYTNTQNCGSVIPAIPVFVSEAEASLLWIFPLTQHMPYF